MPELSVVSLEYGGQNEDGADNIKETTETNYKQIKLDVLSLVESEIERIKTTPELKHLMKETN